MFPDALDLPRPFGPYTLLRRLAVGGMAEVYVAKAEGIGGFEKLVAIKVIHPRFSEDQSFIRMLVDEAKLSVLLTHVNVAQTFDLGCIDDNYFIVMEFVEGADASQVIRKIAEKNVRIPVDLCAYIVSELCHGLDYAHRKRAPSGEALNIVHRDVSPQNVLISFSGEVKVADFGIAKATQRTGHTEAGVIKGKYFYMSPEQAWADPLDARSDVFSAGIVLHELLTGEMVYEADNLPKLLERVRKADVKAPSRVRRDVPPELDEIVMKALHKQPAERWKSGHEMAQALSQWLYRFMPSFTAARLASLMSELFPKEMEAATGAMELASNERVLMPASSDSIPVGTESIRLERMGSDEFRPDPTKSVIFSSDSFEEDTKSAKRRALFEEEATSGEIPRSKATPPMAGESTAVWPDAADDQPSEETARAKSSDLRAARGLAPEEDEWDDSTVIDSNPRRAKASAPPPPSTAALEAARIPPRLTDATTSSSAIPSAASSSSSGMDFPSPVDPTPWPIKQAKTTDSLPQLSGGVPDLSGWKENSDVFSAPAAPVLTDARRAPRPTRRFWLLPLTAVGTMVLLAFIWSKIRMPAAPETRIELVSVPEGAVVRVDGELLEGTTPLFLEDGLTDGQRLTIEATLPDYEPWRRSFEVEPGHTRHIAVFVPLRMDVVIESDPPGAQIEVGGQRLGPAPVTVSDAPLGSVLNVRASKRGRSTVTQRFTVSSDSPSVTIELPER